MERKNYMTYFLIPIIMVFMFLTIMISMAIFSPKNCVVTVLGFNPSGKEIKFSNTSTNYYFRAPKVGMTIDKMDKIKTNYIFDGYYFNYNPKTREFSNKIPDNFQFKKNITIFAKFIDSK